MFGWGGWAKFAAIPALGLNLAIFRYTPRTFMHMAMTVAMNAWLCMNVSWMLSDLDKLPFLMAWAKVLFILGVGFLIAACIRGMKDKELLFEALSRFRRFRIKFFTR